MSELASIRQLWTKKEQAEILVLTGRCLNDGYPLYEAFRVQMFRRRPKIRRHLQEMMDALEQGQPLYLVLDHHGFPSDISGSISIAEASGELAKGLIDSGEMLLQREKNKEMLRKLIRYPIFLLWFFFLMMFAIGQLLLPNFLRLYRSLSIDLPLITRMLLFTMGQFPAILSVFLFLMMICLCTAFFLRRLPAERKLKLIGSVPFAAGVLRFYMTYHFAFYFGSLIRSGLTFPDALKSMAERGASSLLRFEAQRIARSLEKGERLEKLIAERPWYLPELETVIRQGRISGLLGQTLYRFGRIVLERMDERTRALIAICQPAMLVFVGGLVLVLFLSILLPVFRIVNGL